MKWNRHFSYGALAERVRYPLRLLWNWTYSNLHLALQTYYVLDFMYLHKLHAGSISPEHPWATGISPQTGGPVWPHNIVYQSPLKDTWVGTAPEEDGEIVTRVGKFLAAMLKRSTFTEPEIPQGAKRRMPHAVNLLHGSIHYNGAFLILNDLPDGMRHISDRNFVKEIKRFAKQERRELTIVFRERSYHPEEFAWFLAFVRARLPWYANANGPTKKRILAGAPSPYPAINAINGSWVHDVMMLFRGDTEHIVREPIRKSSYFQSSYRGNQMEYTFLERFHAWAQSLIPRLKGFQGSHVFTKRRKIEPENWEKYKLSPDDWRTSYLISHPFASIEHVRNSRQPQD